MCLADPERSTLAEIGKRLGRSALQQVACVAKPDTILAWYRRLIARKFNGSKRRAYPGRPSIAREVEALIVSIARENSGRGYDRIVGALPISAIPSPIRPWGTSFADMGSPPRPSGARRPPGRISLPPTWPSWPAPTSSRSRYSPGKVSPPTTCSSSSS